MHAGSTVFLFLPFKIITMNNFCTFFQCVIYMVFILGRLWLGCVFTQEKRLKKVYSKVSIYVVNLLDFFVFCWWALLSHSVLHGSGGAAHSCKYLNKMWVVVRELHKEREKERHEISITFLESLLDFCFEVKLTDWLYYSISYQY